MVQVLADWKLPTHHRMLQAVQQANFGRGRGSGNGSGSEEEVVVVVVAAVVVVVGGGGARGLGC